MCRGDKKKYERSLGSAIHSQSSFVLVMLGVLEIGNRDSFKLQKKESRIDSHDSWPSTSQKGKIMYFSFKQQFQIPGHIKLELSLNPRKGKEIFTKYLLKL